MFESVPTCTSTVSIFYTGLKFGSKKHFYGRAAAEENFSDFLSALLPAALPCGGQAASHCSCGVPTSRAAAAAANAGMDATRQRERAPLPGIPV